MNGAVLRVPEKQTVLVTDIGDRMSRRSFLVGLLAILVVGLGLRLVFLPADPPTHASVGITWHDEGVWVHNARNRALFGQWHQDEWNPMFVSPVFTGLEYAAFSLFGVGTRQARIVSVVVGSVSVVLLGLGVARVGNRLAGLIASAFLATSYVYVMYNRVALLEATMVACLVAAWYCYVRAERSVAWAWLAGFMAILAFLTKASAAFFVCALGIEALIASGLGDGFDRVGARRAGRITLLGLATAGVLWVVLFIGPNWGEYRFYNLEVYGARRSVLTFTAILDRATWFPIIHDFFTRMWAVTVLAAGCMLSLLARWGIARPAERLLLLWIVLGSAELILHDLGNERRFVFLIPPLVALASIVLGQSRQLLGDEVARIPWRRALVAAPVVLFIAYAIGGAILRLPFLYQTRPGVRFSAAFAMLAVIVLYATWPLLPRRLAASRWSVRMSLVLAAVIVAGDLVQFGQWAVGRTYKNHLASQEIGHLLPPGTLVQGKLANGLALENKIRPLFIGPGFGNYANRTARDDVRYVLTYISPRLGYEGSVITEVLTASPGWRILKSFDVAETAGGHDRAALIEKLERPAAEPNDNDQ